MALKWQMRLGDNSDVPGREEWIQAEVSLLCGIMRQEGPCSGEIRFPVITFGRYNKWESKHLLFDDPKVLGANPESLCQECGVRMYLVRKMRQELKEAAVQWISAKGSTEVDEEQYWKNRR